MHNLNLWIVNQLKCTLFVLYMTLYNYNFILVLDLPPVPTEYSPFYRFWKCKLSIIIKLKINALKEFAILLVITSCQLMQIVWFYRWCRLSCYQIFIGTLFWSELNLLTILCVYFQQTVYLKNLNHIAFSKHNAFQTRF